MTTIYTHYSTFLKSGGNFKAAVEKMLGKRKYLPTDVVDRLAVVHAERYGCTQRVTATGRATFYKGAKRDGTAQRAWELWVGCFDPRAKSTRGGATSKQADPIEKLLREYKALSAADKRRFKASLAAL